MRAAVASGLGVLVLSTMWLLRPARIVARNPGPADLDLAQGIASSFPSTHAFLALLGDKQLMFNAQRSGFVMYGAQGGSWIAMGDPVATDERQQEELAWEFRERCDRNGVRCVFHQVDAARLSLYLDMGLTPVNFGEEARVRLDSFDMEGSERKSLRRDANRAVKAGCHFEVLQAEHVASLMPEFKRISDSWLALKHGQEKGFSLGFFDEPYLLRLPVAVVRREDTVVAFANLWLGGGHELAPDLMRHSPDAPPGTMDFLFTQLMLWGRQQGFHWFNLGVAPLSGLEDRTLAPLWHRLGARVYRHGEHFYHFEGLRRFKEKFDPVWEPKYLAAPAGLTLPLTLLDLTRLISKHATITGPAVPRPPVPASEDRWDTR